MQLIPKPELSVKTPKLTHKHVLLSKKNVVKGQAVNLS